MEFSEICLKQESVYFLHKNIVNLYISYELDTLSRDLNTNFALRNCLFGAVKLTKNNSTVFHNFHVIFWGKNVIIIVHVSILMIKTKVS